MENEIKLLSSKVFRRIFLWASESIWRSFVVVTLIVVFGVPIIGYLQEQVRKFPYINTLVTFSQILGRFMTPADYIIAIVFILIIFRLVYLSRELKKTYLIQENFNSPDFNKWSIPVNSGWTIQKCENVPGNMVSVTGSSYPGILKGAYGWYDYEFSFMAKMDQDVPEKGQNFSVTVRSENYLNGIVLQITNTHFKPHLLYNGTYIRDVDNDLQLSTVLKVGVWIKVKIKVIGNLIEVSIDGYKVNYKIPTKVLNVENQILSDTTTLKEVEDSGEKIKAKQTEILNDLDKLKKLKGDEYEVLFKEINEKMDKLPAYSKVIFEYQKGSVGFRESGNEHAYFRNLVLKKI